LEAYWAAGLT